MKPTEELHELGQSLWLDNITRDMLGDGTLGRYIDELSITGLTSNPTIFDKAISKGDAYDEQITELTEQGQSPEDIFFAVAVSDLQGAADLFAPVHERTDGVDGFVSLEVSPLLADDASATIDQVRRLHDQGNRDNLFIKIPGTVAGLEAIEESIYAGLPINVTLLFSTDQYLAAAEAYMRGIERRIRENLDPVVTSVASLFISRWDVAVADEVSDELRNRLGIAVGKRTYRAYRELLESDRWQQLENDGARPQRLLFASTGTKDPSASDVLYVEAFAAPDTINTMPDKTLLAFADHGEVGDPIPADGGDAAEVLAAFQSAGVDTDELATRLQHEGAEAFNKSWNDLLESIESESRRLAATG
ncbi:MAG TPA: transaldolase [Solirubrobacterales bacterium]|nr:transaldolase [Solirubrobacterales bacterium]